MIYLFCMHIFLTTFLPKIGFEVKFLPFHLNIVDILFVLMLIYTAIKSFRLKFLHQFYPLVILLCWGLFSAVFGYFNSAPPNKIIDEFLRQYIYIFVAIVTFFILKNFQRQDKVISIFLFALGLLSLYGILEGIFGEKFIQLSKTVLLFLGYPKRANFFIGCNPGDPAAYGRIITTLLCWNGSGQYLAAGAVLLLAKGLLDKNISTKWRIAYFIVFLLCSVAVIFTRSRSSWVGMFVAITLLGIIVFKKKFWILPASLCLLLLLFIIFSPRTYSRVKSFLALRHDGAAWGRVEAVKASLPAIKKSPLIGYGLGMFTAQKIPADYTMYASLDCFYVRYTVTNGILGLLIFLWVIFWLFRKVLIHIKWVEINQNWLLSGAICGLIVIIVGALFDSMLTVSTYISSLFWFYYGLTLRKIYENK